MLRRLLATPAVVVVWRRRWPPPSATPHAGLMTARAASTTTTTTTTTTSTANTAAAAATTVCSAATRDALTTRLTAVKEEYKGQSLDLADMHEAAMLAMRNWHDCLTRQRVDDAALKAKSTTLMASMKAYAMRLSNLHIEARAVQSEVDALLTRLWGTDAPRGASFSIPPADDAAAAAAEATKAAPTTTTTVASDAAASTATATRASASDAHAHTTATNTRTTTATATAAPCDFDVEPPPPLHYQRLSPATEKASSASASANTTATTQPPVERVEAERVDGHIASTPSAAAASTEIEVETVELDATTVAATDDSRKNNDNNDDDDASAVDMSITDMTRELYERGVDFADCRDARSLRQRYRDVIAATRRPTTSPRRDGVNDDDDDDAARTTTTTTSHASPQQQQQQPDLPPRPAYAYRHDWQYDSADSNNNSNSGSTTSSSSSSSSDDGNTLAPDPYPGAERKVIDASKYVWQVKEQVAQEKGMRASDIDLWSGNTLLQDHKHLYEYPTAQYYPIEVKPKRHAPQ